MLIKFRCQALLHTKVLKKVVEKIIVHRAIQAVFLKLVKNQENNAIKRKEKN